MRISFDLEIPAGWLGAGEDPALIARVKLVEFLGSRLLQAQKTAIERVANALCSPGGESDGNKSVQPFAAERIEVPARELSGADHDRAPHA